MERDTVYVLMSTYNGDKYIDEQIESILRQKRVNVHLFIRDDGSNDGTLMKLEQWAIHDNVTVLFGENIGYEKSFMELVLLVPEIKGYYAFADQDDVWLEDKLHSAISILKKYNKPAAYCTSHKYVDEELNEIKCFSVLDELPYGEIISGNALVKGIFGLGCTLVWNEELCSIIKREKYEQFQYGHDNFVCVLASLVGVLYKDDRETILYRQHESNASGKKEKTKNVVHKLERAYKNMNNNKSFELRKFIYDKFSGYMPIDKKLDLLSTIEYRDNLRKRIHLLLKGLSKGLNNKMQMKYYVLVLLGKF